VKERKKKKDKKKAKGDDKGTKKSKEGAGSGKEVAMVDSEPSGEAEAVSADRKSKKRRREEHLESATTVEQGTDVKMKVKSSKKKKVVDGTDVKLDPLGLDASSHAFGSNEGSGKTEKSSKKEKKDKKSRKSKSDTAVIGGE